ncbi:MAG: DEAD/DEAH box helicase [Thermoplasmatota archaeon]
MLLKYRPEGERIYLEVDDRVDDESRVWKTLERSGVPVTRDTASRALIAPRFIPKEALPKLERACRMLRFTLKPATGVAPIAAGRGASAAYAQARPLDPNAVIEAALRDPHEATSALRDARYRLAAWVREHPTFRSEVDADLRAIGEALDKLEASAATAARATRSLRAAELSAMLHGVAGEDAFAAHEALKKLDATAQEMETATAEDREKTPARRFLPEDGDIAGFAGKLRPYQRDGVEFLLRRNLSAILADDMGLGKTVMAIAAIQAAGERAFVVGPANVLYNWADEIQRFTGAAPLVYHQSRFRGNTGSPWLITTYDSLRTLSATDSEVTSRPILILDEAHYIRNPETQRNKLVRALPQTRRILLTGTPLVNGIEDYYELLREVGVSPWGSRQAFRDAWVVDNALFDRYAQVRNATAKLLQQVTRHVLLRRKKEDVLADLPPRTIRVVRDELPPAELQKYQQLEDYARRTLETSKGEAAIFAALHALRHHLAIARVPTVLERVQELLQAGESVVVYSQYLEPLRLLLKDLGEGAAMLEGATPPRERLHLAKALGQGSLKVLLAQMDAGGIGLNFTGARFVLFVHLGWTPSGHAQAIDRTHRIGQDRPVLVEFFVTPGTVDERLARILLRKEADQNLVLADDSDVLNRNELARVLLEKPVEPDLAEAPARRALSRDGAPASGTMTPSASASAAGRSPSPPPPRSPASPATRRAPPDRRP